MTFIEHKSPQKHLMIHLKCFPAIRQPLKANYYVWAILPRNVCSKLQLCKEKTKKKKHCLRIVFLFNNVTKNRWLLWFKSQHKSHLEVMHGIRMLWGNTGWLNAFSFSINKWSLDKCHFGGLSCVIQLSLPMGKLLQFHYVVWYLQ